MTLTEYWEDESELFFCGCGSEVAAYECCHDDYPYETVEDTVYIAYCFLYEQPVGLAAY